MGTPKDSEKTRAKIIEAAGQLFAERGLAGVTVREIVSAADTHLGALNYHFRSKEALYRDVLLYACRKAAITPHEQRILLQLPPEEALYVLIREAMKSYQPHKARSWQTTILARECYQPSAVFMEVVDAYFAPETNLIAGIIGKVAGKPKEEMQVRFAVIVLFGLLDTFGMYGQLIDAVAPGLTDHLQKGNRLAKQLFHLVVEVARATP